MITHEKQFDKRARRRAVLFGVLIFLTSFLAGLCASLILQALW